MNVVFLDYDGVVNTIQWSKHEGKWVCDYSHPWKNVVNNVQAVQWVSEFCEKYGYKIVVTSTWRFNNNYIECLRNAGLRESVSVIGRTPSVNGCRGDEIGAWLHEHPEVGSYLIFDDESDMGIHNGHLVKCNTNTGFGFEEYGEARQLHNSLSRG